MKYTKMADANETPAQGEPLARATLGANFTHLVEAFPKNDCTNRIVIFKQQHISKIKCYLLIQICCDTIDLAVIEGPLNT